MSVTPPAILVPSGLAQVHPQLETCIKSIKSAVSALNSSVTAVAPQAGNAAMLASGVAALRTEVAALEQAVNAIDPPPSYRAGGGLSAYSVIYEISKGIAAPASSAAAASSGAIIGIATAAATPGSAVAYAGNGDTVTNSAWSFSAGPVFLGSAGALTQTIPTGAYPVQVGTAISATSVMVGVQGPFVPLLNASTDPAAVTIYLNSLDGTLRYYHGSVWIHLGTLVHISAAAASVSLNNQAITDLANPTNAQDAVNLQTLQSYLANLSSRQECAYATAAALPANTYSNGVGGIGATLTAAANGPLSVDGVAVAAGQRILVKNESATAHNGVYVVTQAGSGSSPYTLTRSTDADTAAQLGPGLIVPVEAATGLTGGAANNGLVFISLAPSPFVVGSSSLTFASTGQSYTADGTTISLSGTQFSLAAIANLALLANVSGVTAKPSGTTLTALLDG